jgi:hypothetical protein
MHKTKFIIQVNNDGIKNTSVKRKKIIEKNLQQYLPILSSFKKAELKEIIKNKLEPKKLNSNNKLVKI